MNDVSPDNPLWHELGAATALEMLQVDQDTGLSSETVRRRLERHGRNEIQEGVPTSPWRVFFKQFEDFMVIVLLVAAIVAGVVGELKDSIAIVVIVLLNALLGAIQQYRAERAIAALRSMASPQARVRRDGEVKAVPSAELVPGDIVLLESGNLVPVDARLMDCAGMRTLEAALTGESQPVDKCTESLQGDDLPLGDRRNMVYKGTQVSQGHATGVVVATGMATELGRIAALLGEEVQQSTPLQIRLTAFGKRLAIAVLLICAVIFAAGILRGEALVLMFLTAVSLAVAAIPEALPAVVTISLALGARKMSRKNALVRRLPAVETLGSVTYICADKTGTLTENSMHLEAIYADGDTKSGLPAVGSQGQLWDRIGQALALNNDATASSAAGFLGDPTEVALLRAALESGVDWSALQAALPRVAEIPFDAQRKRMTTVHRDGDGVVAFVKGAPEQVLSHCTRQLGAHRSQPLHAQSVLQEAQRLSARGYRVIAYAERRFHDLPETITPRSVEIGLTFVALAALIDPPREEVAEAVAQCRTAGITPVMITGDHPETARAIATRLGIVDDDDTVISGAELATLSPAELQELVPKVCIYARVSPEQKIDIVEALQNRGEWVAMTGDGVNDAPALKRAVIGVAMGRGGTDVAREAAEMILLDDNFATIVGAVREGRRIFDNLRKFVKYTMTSNAGEIWTLFLAPFLGLPIPLLPIQILWINLVTDGLPGLALSVETEEKHIMHRPPRPQDESMFSHGMWQHIVWVGLLIGGLSILGQAWAIERDSDAWQTVVFTVLTLSQLAHVLAIRSERDSLFSIGLASNLPLLGAVVLTVLLQMAIIYIPIFNPIFKTQPLSGQELMVCFTLPVVVFAAVELEKWLVRRGWIYNDRAGREMQA
jgi:Ca2+-transporting ATPase